MWPIAGSCSRKWSGWRQLRQGLRDFRCVLALARRGEVIATFEGASEGHVLRAERGVLGFGYDPLFQPEGFEKTFAELSADEKNAISHRALAVSKLCTFLRDAESARSP
jgi:XTP/dITP diphosphohydrolase